MSFFGSSSQRQSLTKGKGVGGKPILEVVPDGRLSVSCLIAKSKFKLFVSPNDSYEGWSLAGHGEPYHDCGSFWSEGCLNTEGHIQDSLDVVSPVGMAYIKRVKRSCGRLGCPVCYESASYRESLKIEFRLKQKKGRIIHFIVSPPRSLWFLSVKKMRCKAYRVAKKVGFKGGSCIFHPYRKDFFTNKWYFSPHFHMIGHGWIHSVKEEYEKNGWVAKNLGVRKSIQGTAFYQLSHAGVHKRHHTITWFGHVAYNNFKAEPLPKPDPELCPWCKNELQKVVWEGIGDNPLPDEVGTYFVRARGWRYERGFMGIKKRTLSNFG